MARDAFKTSAVATESTGREPVEFGAAVSPSTSTLAGPENDRSGSADLEAASPGRFANGSTPGQAEVAGLTPQGASTANLGGGDAAFGGGAGDGAVDGDDIPGASDQDDDVPKAVR